jgi:hypothetical protein
MNAGTSLFLKLYVIIRPMQHTHILWTRWCLGLCCKVPVTESQQTVLLGWLIRKVLRIRIHSTWLEKQKSKTKNVPSLCLPSVVVNSRWVWDRRRMSQRLAICAAGRIWDRRRMSQRLAVCAAGRADGIGSAHTRVASSSLRTSRSYVVLASFCVLFPGRRRARTICMHPHHNTNFLPALPTMNNMHVNMAARVPHAALFDVLCGTT